MIGKHSPFEVYFGRKSNRLDKLNLSGVVDYEEMEVSLKHFFQSYTFI